MFVKLYSDIDEIWDLINFIFWRPKMVRSALPISSRQSRAMQQVVNKRLKYVYPLSSIFLNYTTSAPSPDKRRIEKWERNLFYFLFSFNYRFIIICFTYRWYLAVIFNTYRRLSSPIICGTVGQGWTPLRPERCDHAHIPRPRVGSVRGVVVPKESFRVARTPSLENRAEILKNFWPVSTFLRAVQWFRNGHLLFSQDLIRTQRIDVEPSPSPNALFYKSISISLC